jgi:hypothetical protein
MKKCADTMRKEQLRTVIDGLTEENRRYVLGVLEALRFAQTTPEQVVNSQPVEADKNNVEGAML